MRISDWSSDVCSSDLQDRHAFRHPQTGWRHSRGILERPVTAHEKFSESPRSRHYPLSSTPCRGIRHRGGSPMNIHPIRTEADYKAALREMSAYFRSEEHTSELQSLMRSSNAVFCLKKKTSYTLNYHEH